ncbi:MAG: lipopolysaccharide biosynthesis protein [Burkholderiales bacterium]
MKDVGHKMAKGAAWMVAFKLAERSIGIVSTVILARLLIPADFGLVALAMAIIAVLELLSAFSFDIALIQNQNAGREHYNTAWTLNVVFFASSALVLVLLAHPAAVFYDEPRLEAVMYCLAFGTFILGFENIGVVAFRKDLEFNKEFKFLLAKKLAAFCATVTLAVVFRSYWALVAGIITSRLAGVMLSYFLHPFRPRFSLAGRHDLLRFSKWLLISNIIFFINDRSSDFILGKIAGLHELGIFKIAHEISTLPTTELVAPINRAVFPAYSKMFKDLAILRQGYLNVLSMIALVGLPAGIGIIAIAEPLVLVMLGEKWVESIPVIALLALYGLFLLLQSSAGYVYLAMGRPEILAMLSGAQLIIRIPALVIGIYHGGAIGAAWALVITEALKVPAVYYIVFKLLGIRTVHVLDKLWRPLAASTAMFYAVQMAQQAWGFSGDLKVQVAWLITLVASGALIYILTLTGLWKLSRSPDGAERYILSRVREAWPLVRP